VPEAEKLIGRRTAPAPPFDGATHDAAPEGGAQHAQPEPCSAEDRDAKDRLAAKENAAQEGESERARVMERMRMEINQVKSSQVISESLSISKPITVGKKNRPCCGSTRFRRDFTPRNDRGRGIVVIVAADDRSVHSATPTTRFTQRRRAGTDRDVGVDTSG
jgi:hypothetical protein